MIILYRKEETTRANGSDVATGNCILEIGRACGEPVNGGQEDHYTDICSLGNRLSRQRHNRL